jgi:hypothetical protein
MPLALLTSAASTSGGAHRKTHRDYHGDQRGIDDPPGRKSGRRGIQPDGGYDHRSKRRVLPAEGSLVPMHESGVPATVTLDAPWGSDPPLGQ